jgi:hypothetical protein
VVWDYGSGKTLKRNKERADSLPQSRKKIAVSFEKVFDTNANIRPDQQ